jgi:hypothetical protein
MIELVERYQRNGESGRDRIVGWDTREVAGMDEAEMKEFDIRKDVFLPPLLREALVALDKRNILMLSRSGTMTRYFIKES